ncbi:MAG TPA: hypothetical protein VEB68_09405 [Croceibacterium sp.]|nr:hypothetical protein [Croceibacterium sp.]
MDLNQLYFDHQLIMMQAERTLGFGARRELEIGASHLAGRIGCMQRALGAAGAPAWEALAVGDRYSLASPVRHQQGYAS